MKKVSFVCTTYRRFTCVQRIVAQFHAQTYPNKELIIFNTDMEYPYEKNFEDDNVIIVNNDIDYETNLPYTNRAQICRDAVTHASGFYFMLADDDDIYLPWHIQQAVDRIDEDQTDAWKPQKSFFATGNRVELSQNVMEASIIVKMNRIREIGFKINAVTGYEGLSWYDKLKSEGHITENYSYAVSSYCFNWSDPPEIGGNKQSGTIGRENNFELHKLETKDYVKGKLEKTVDLSNVYEKLYNFYRNNLHEFNSSLLDKYVAQHIF